PQRFTEICACRRAVSEPSRCFDIGAGKFPGVVLLSGGYSWVPLQTVSPAGSRSALATSSRAAAAERDAFASVCDIWSFRMADTSNCRPIWRTGRARAAGASLGGARLENNFGERNRREARALNP